MCFVYENRLVYPVYLSDQKPKNCMDLLLINYENNSHYVYIKDFKEFMCNKVKCRNKKHFCRYRLQCFSSENVLTEHKEVFFKINLKQTVKLKSSSIKFKNYHKQLAAPLKIYADLVCDVKKVKNSDKSSDRGDNASQTEKYQDYIPCSFAYNVFCVEDKFSQPIVFYRGENAGYRFIEAILKNNYKAF